jgi:hypothetical protein
MSHGISARTSMPKPGVDGKRIRELMEWCAVSNEDLSKPACKAAFLLHLDESGKGSVIHQHRTRFVSAGAFSAEMEQFQGSDVPLLLEIKTRASGRGLVPNQPKLSMRAEILLPLSP